MKSSQSSKQSTSRDSTSLHFEQWPSSGPPLLLLHGVTRNWRDWEPLLPGLKQRWHVFALDHVGHGGSPWSTGHYLVADYARCAASFLQANFTKPVVVMGHSLGAMVALSLAAECESLVAGIVLEDPPFHTMGRNIASTPYLAQFSGMAEVARRGGTIPEIADGLAAIRINATQRLGDVRDRASLEFSAQCLAQVDPDIFTPLIASRWMEGFDPESLWPKVRCPALLLQGDPASGGTFTDADVSDACQSLRAQRLVRFPGVGHQIHRTRPTEVLDALHDFVTTFDVQPGTAK